MTEPDRAALGFRFWDDEDDKRRRNAGKVKSMPIQAITMPKWGLAMDEGLLARWTVDEGAEIARGQEILDIETTKIANAFESPVAGVLRRKVAAEGSVLPVGALLGVTADRDTPDADIDAFVADFQANFKPPEKSAASGPAYEFVDAGGKRIRRLVAGPAEGVPILLIHGFGSDLTTWMFNQAALAEERPVHAIDLPGHGGSTKDVGDASAESLARTVADYMDAAGLERAHLVGHSLGGAVATAIAAENPDRVAALTLIAPAGFGAEIAGDFIEGFITENRARKLRPFIEMLVANPSLVTADMVEEVLKFKRLDGALDALRAVADANFAGGAQKVSVRDRIDDVPMPVQVIWGSDDRILPSAHSEGLPETVAVHHVEGAGHIPHMEKASDVNEIIKALP
jgi:pyruvate dehydrogenase E2 component (dihydrolipoamide acetyltransferase)